MKNIILAIVVILGVTLSVMFLFNHFTKKPEQIDRIKYDSLQSEFGRLAYKYDSVKQAQAEIEREYLSTAQDQQEKIFNYRLKIKNYEKEYALIASMPVPVLLDSITRYYENKH